MEGFIVRDEVAEEEMMEVDDQIEGEKPERKKKKKRVERKLDDEDFDLIQENIGVDVHKRKRL